VTRRILVADTPLADRRLAAILSGYELVFERTLDAAGRALAGPRFDIVLVGVHFDESRMFDLLRQLRTTAPHAGLPVVCVRSHQFVSPAITIEGLEIAAKALGCKLFLDLTKYSDDAQGNAEVRRLLDGLLAP